MIIADQCYNKAMFYFKFISHVAVLLKTSAKKPELNDELHSIIFTSYRTSTDTSKKQINGLKDCELLPVFVLDNACLR